MVVYTDSRGIAAFPLSMRGFQTVSAHYFFEVTAVNRQTTRVLFVIRQPRYQDACSIV